MRPQSPRSRAIIALAGLAAPLAALPEAASSDFPGTTVPGTSTTTTTTSAQPPTATAARVADVVPTHRRLNVTSGRCALVSGYLSPGIAGAAVLLQRQTGRGWRTIAHTTSGPNGRFRVRYRTGRPGSARLRLQVSGEAPPAYHETVGRLNVYRQVYVSWYGPGLYGNHLSCGGTLGPGTIGVANKTLPCGTRVTLRYHGRMLRVRVIDRGPYVFGREYDLTAATRARLQTPSTGVILATA